MKNYSVFTASEAWCNHQHLLRCAVIKEVVLLHLVLANTSGRLVSLRNGCYDNVPIDIVAGEKKVVDVEKYYNIDRLRPKYETFMRQPLFIMTSDL